MGLFDFLKKTKKSPLAELLESPAAKVFVFEQELINLRKYMNNLYALGREEDAKKELAAFIMKYAKNSKESETAQREIAQISYYIAYQILPEMVFSSWSEFCDQWNSYAHYPWLLAIEAALRKNQMLKFEEIQQYKYYQGDLSSHDKYLLIEYPVPPTVDEADFNIEKRLENISKQLAANQMPVLGPYFSAIIFNEKENDKKIFVLGQSPSPGITTIRAVTGVRAHGNCGRGPEPTALAFLESLKRFLK